jgi:adenylate cyclase
VASRLCSLAKAEEIIISEATYLKVKEHIVAEALLPAKVKGKIEPLMNYLVTGLKNS